MNLHLFSRSRTAAVLVGAGALVLAGTTGAVAKSLVTSHDIQNGTVQAADLHEGAVTHRVIKDGAVRGKDISDSLMARLQGTGPAGPQGPEGPQGHEGPQGPKGPNGLAGARYSVANYENGGGGIATVACDADDATSQQYTAISGGAFVQVVDDQGKVVSSDTEPITSSSPGRMDWSTNMPKDNRLDGWIVKFGNGTAPTAKAGDVLKVWALCVPNTDIPVVVNNY